MASERQQSGNHRTFRTLVFGYAVSPQVAVIDLSLGAPTKSHFVLKFRKTKPDSLAHHQIL